MSDTYQGTVSFINHEKGYAMLEYEEGNKKKTVRADVSDAFQKKQKEKGLIRKTHHFMVGDVVSFLVKLSDRGDRMMATKLEFLYNNALDALINKSLLSNKFIGYLKVVDDKYFVKEIESYLFFPVPFSPWQLLPDEQELNEQVTFSLENIEKKEKIYASLFNNRYIPQFEQAVKLFKAKTTVEAEVYKATPLGVYINVVGDKVRAKLPADETIKVGDKINIVINFLSKSKIAVQKIA